VDGFRDCCVCDAGRVWVAMRSTDYANSRDMNPQTKKLNNKLGIGVGVITLLLLLFTLLIGKNVIK
jgi:hypothetical protein